jgi:hypothetical protein
VFYIRKRLFIKANKYRYTQTHKETYTHTLSPKKKKTHPAKSNVTVTSLFRLSTASRLASSFATAPRSSYPGVAAGGGGAAIRGDVGLGAPLAPGDPGWAVFGEGGEAPSLGDIPTTEVAEFDPTYAPDGDPVDAEEREREEEEARAAGKGSEEREREEEEEEEAGPGNKKSERERERDAARRAAGFESFATKAPPAAEDVTAPPPPVRGLALLKGPWAEMPGPAPPSSPDPRTTALAADALPPARPPRPASKGIKATVDGLNCTDNALVNRKLTEPPDLTLCSGGGFLLQLVNSAYAIHDAATGARLAGPFSLYDLFGVPKNSSMTDPGCIFDAGGSKRFSDSAGVQRGAGRRGGHGRRYRPLSIPRQRARVHFEQLRRPVGLGPGTGHVHKPARALRA